MDSDKTSNIEKGKTKQFKSKGILDNIKSIQILRKICDQIQKHKFYKLFNYNKNIQKKLNIDINDYKQFSESIIKIKIIPKEYEFGTFININDKKDEAYFHIYFNGSENEIKRNYFDEDDEVTEIKIIIDYPIKSFYKLFKYCDCIESICFINFKRNNITNMSYMFSGCASLKIIDFSDFNSINVTNMEKMFSYCPSLKELNLSKFNTKNVINMNSMFEGCSSLEKLNLSNFNISMVKNMENMFSFCPKLKELNHSNFSINNKKK